MWYNQYQMNLKVGEYYQNKHVGNIRQIIAIDLPNGIVVTSTHTNITNFSVNPSFSIGYIEDNYIHIEGFLLKEEVKDWLKENE